MCVAVGDTWVGKTVIGSTPASYICSDGSDPVTISKARVIAAPVFDVAQVYAIQQVVWILCMDDADALLCWRSGVIKDMTRDNVWYLVQIDKSNAEWVCRTLLYTPRVELRSLE